MSTIHCDLVFDILTRGPFPSGDATDEPVEKHLACCHECRQLAEALRPAVELLHESIGADESAELPGYRGSLRGLRTAPHPVAVDELLAEAVSVVRSAPLAQSFAANIVWFRLAAAILLGLGGAILVHACLQTGGDGGTVADVRTVAQSRHLPDAAGEAKLAGLQLPGACLLVGKSRPGTEENVAAMVASADLSRFATASGFVCCRQCHGAERAPEPPAISTITGNQCTVCHR